MQNGVRSPRAPDTRTSSLAISAPSLARVSTCGTLVERSFARSARRSEKRVSRSAEGRALSASRKRASKQAAHRMMLLPASLLSVAFCLRPPVGLRPRTSPIVASASFDDLRALDNKIEKLSSMGISGLRGFYDDSTRCFALTPGVSRVSVTSTVFSLLAIDAAPNAWRASQWPTTRIKGCLLALLEADWRENDVYAHARPGRPCFLRSHTHARARLTPPTASKRCSWSSLCD